MGFFALNLKDLKPLKDLRYLKHHLFNVFINFQTLLNNCIYILFYYTLESQHQYLWHYLVVYYSFHISQFVNGAYFLDNNCLFFSSACIAATSVSASLLFHWQACVHHCNQITWRFEQEQHGCYHLCSVLVETVPEVLHNAVFRALPVTS